MRTHILDGGRTQSGDRLYLLATSTIPPRLLLCSPAHPYNAPLDQPLQLAESPGHQAPATGEGPSSTLPYANQGDGPILSLIM